MLCSDANVKIANNTKSIISVLFGGNVQSEDVAIGEDTSTVVTYGSDMSISIDDDSSTVLVNIPTDCTDIVNVPVPFVQVTTTTDRHIVTISTANGSFSPDTAAIVTINVSDGGGGADDIDDDNDNDGSDTVGKKSSSGISTEVITGIVIGSIVFIVLVALSFYIVRMKK